MKTNLSLITLAVLAALPAAALAQGSWLLNGNSGTTPGTNFLGTTDTNALELKVNNARILRLEPNTNSPNIIGGYFENSIALGAYGSTISGGGSTGKLNQVSAPYGFIGGGEGNVLSNSHAVVAGGERNKGIGARATVGGGRENSAGGQESTVAGGHANVVSADFGTIAGGRNNQIDGPYGFVGGGYDNHAFEYSVVGGGLLNQATGTVATVSGGRGNRAWSAYSAVVGGRENLADGEFAFAGGGSNNRADGDYSSVAAGLANIAYSLAAVGGGAWNAARGSYSVVGGGETNVASGDYSVVGGGHANVASGWHASVAGGEGNIAAGNYSLAAGRVAQANHHGTFVWNDATGSPFASTAENQFLIRAAGGVGIGTATIPPQTSLHVAGNSVFASRVGIGVNAPSAELDVAGKVLCQVLELTSDRQRKSGFEPINPREILEKVARLPIATWHYTNASGVRHIGPVAQDFQAAFAVGSDDKHIATIDADGVALAAIQALSQLLEEKESRISALELKLAAMEERLSRQIP